MYNHNLKPKDVYLTAEDVMEMNDDELVGVNALEIYSHLALLSIDPEVDREAFEILNKTSSKIIEREKAVGYTLWGAKMSVKEVKTAFRDIEKLAKTTFKKVI